MGKIGRIEPRRVARPAVERRAVPRIGASVAVRLRFPALDVGLTGTAHNLNRTGIFVLLDCPPPIGAELEVELTVETALVPLQARGVVVRHGMADEQPGVAVRFTWVSSELELFCAALADRRKTT